VVQKFILLKVGFKMKMEIIESDLKQLFQWIKNLEELCRSQQVLIEVLDERVSHIELLLTQEDNK